MVEYYKFDVISNDGSRLIYPMDLSLIYHIKYEWNPVNNGLGGGVVHAVCVCKSDSTISGLTAITLLEYDDFDAIDLVLDKTVFTAQSADAPTMTVTLPAAKGAITFKFILPDKTILQITKNVEPSKQAICGPSDLSNFEVGEIRVKVFSNIWYTPHLKRPEVTINAE